MIERRRGQVFAVALALFGLCAPAAAEEAPARDPNLPWLDNEFYKVHLDLRARIELADQDGVDDAQAYTIRGRLGLESKPYYGFSALAEVGTSWSLDGDSYFDGASTPTNETKIADPEVTELNRAWLLFEKDEWLGARAKGGRQRIILDDARFIGNVGWRQNEQTFDAALAQSSAGVEDLTLQYAYLWDIRRIFGDQGPTAVGGRDWNSDSHLVRANYAGIDWLQMTAFAYLLDFQKDSPGNSSNSYGLRLWGGTDIGDDFHLGYAGSYAFQTDAGDNLADYEAHYVAASVDFGVTELGSVAAGYELFSSDDGNARFVTPLATAHKFNGYADAFLDNGGPDGLQDLFFTVAPELPWKLKGKLVYHEFFSDQGGDHLGRELDGLLSRPINAHLVALTKFGWFDADDPSRADIWRFWVQLEFKY